MSLTQKLGKGGRFARVSIFMRNAGKGFSGRLGKAGRKVLLFIIKKPQFYDFFFFVEPEADKSAGLKLLGERGQAV